MSVGNILRCHERKMLSPRLVVLAMNIFISIAPDPETTKTSPLYRRIVAIFLKTISKNLKHCVSEGRNLLGHPILNRTRRRCGARYHHEFLRLNN